MIKRQLYVIQLGGVDIDWGSVCGLRRGVREAFYPSNAKSATHIP
jgi:hypothetical protein